MSRGMNENMSKTFTRIEIEEAISLMAHLKSPRPDGFGPSFIKNIGI